MAGSTTSTRRTEAKIATAMIASTAIPTPLATSHGRTSPRSASFTRGTNWKNAVAMPIPSE
jgi:hypothetical protein